ncbi:MAG: hypothetical protein U1E46_02835 [Hyphomicrobiales bacterium]
MFRWLRVSEGTYHDRVTGAFTDRMAAYRRLGPSRQDAVAAAFVLTWRDFLEECGSPDAFLKADREDQKRLITRLVDYEARTEAEGNEAEAISSALMSFYLASVAAHDREALALMVPPLEEIGRRIDPDFTLPPLTAT